jgi:hypothetical protein
MLHLFSFLFHIISHIPVFQLIKNVTCIYWRIYTESIAKSDKETIQNPTSSQNMNQMNQDALTF